ncbi:MAG: sodium:solute symporter family protein [Peptococcaceae bacterium]|jgi:SSS family solute:Na+ symporter|nr:sodium:solute symporter family protein [Peptococcaceae bacterium]MDH7524951.1 sodium:solute symporter family protein [Peptococcaceae bacterium]
MGVLIAVIVYTVGISLITTYLVKRNEKAGKDNFMLASHSLPWYVVGVTMGLTVLGAVHVFGLLEMGFIMGAGAIWFSLAVAFSIVLAGFFTGPWVRKLKFATMPEFFAAIFGEKIRLLAVCGTVGVVWGYLTLETQGLGILFSLFTGWDIKPAIILGAVLGLLYVYLAGMKQIGWLNLVNTVVIYSGLIVGIVFFSAKLPGGNWEQVNNFYLQKSQAWMLNILSTPEILYGFALSLLVATAFANAVSQTLLQSAISADDEASIRKSTWVAVPVNGLFGVFTVAMGIAAASVPEYAKLGPKMAGPTMIVNYLPPWLVAWLLAGFLAAVLSTFAMHSMSTATLFVKDIYVNRYKPNATEEEQTRLCRILILLLAASATAVGTFLPTIVAAVSWLNSFLAPLFFVLVAGLFWKRSEAAGTITILVAWIVNILWSFTSLPKLLNMPQDINGYITVSITLVLGIVLFAAMDGKPGLFKERKENLVSVSSAE